MPASWPVCIHCNFKFSQASIAKHEKRCKMRADVQAEHQGLLQLRKLEGPRPAPLANWPKCVNCGESYGPTAIAAHTVRCKKILPHGANGYGLQDHHKDPKFSHIYRAARLNVEAEAAKSVADEVQTTFRGLGKSIDSMLGKLGPKIDRPTLERLHKLFDRFDENKDEQLSLEELGVLMHNVFPTRCADADDLVGEFQQMDLDGNGAITFDEFAKRYIEMREAVDPRYDEACAMFDFFDADESSTLDPDEFLALLNQIFPEHCDENEKRAFAAFEEADIDASGSISFPEFIAYYDVLRKLYDDAPNRYVPSADEQAAIDARKLRECEEALVSCRCGRRFLPSVLPQHQRTCDACKPKKREVQFLEEQPQPEQDPLSSDAPEYVPPIERTRTSIEFGDNDANTFVSCEWCRRTFFPDRLEVHYRVCKKREDGISRSTGIRPTMTGTADATVGLYRSMKSGKWSQSGKLATDALPEVATSFYSPQMQQVVDAKAAAEAERKRIAMEREAARAAAEIKAAAEAKAAAEHAERVSMMKNGWVV